MFWRHRRNKNKPTNQDTNNVTVRKTIIVGNTTVDVLVGGGTHHECKQMVARQSLQDPGVPYFIAY